MTDFGLLPTTLSQQITWFLAHFLWQGFVIGVLALATRTVTGRCSANVRYSLGVFFLLTLILSVPLTCFIGAERFTATITPRSPDSLPSSDSADFESLATTSVETDAEGIEPAVSTAFSPLARVARYVATVYLLGVGLMLLRMVFSGIGVRRLRRRGIATTDAALLDRLCELSQQIGLRSRPALLVCERVAVPVVVGVLRPVILLPAFAVSGMTSDELDAVLLHELAHIRRSDLIICLLQRVIESVFFFHPVTWYLSWILHTERELCCDDIVLRRCGRTTYASGLVRIAETLVTPQQPLTAVAAIGSSPSQLKRRVMRILGTEPSQNTHKPSLVFALSCVALLSIVVVRVRAQSSPDNCATPPPPEIIEKVKATATPTASQADAVSTSKMREDIWRRTAEARKARPSRFDLGTTPKRAKKIEEALQSHTHLTAHDVPLIEIIDAIQEQHKIPIAWDNEALSKVDFDPAKEFASMEAVSISLRSALRLLLDQHKLTYLLERNQLVITTQAKAHETIAQMTQLENALELITPRAPQGRQLRPIELSKSADLGNVTVALEAFLEGKGIPEGQLSYHLQGRRLNMICEQQHYETIQAFLKSRGWTSADSAVAIQLKMTAAEAVAKVISAVFDGTPDMRIKADVKTNRILLSGSPQRIQTAKQLIQTIDAHPTQKPQARTKAVPWRQAQPNVLQSIVGTPLESRDWNSEMRNRIETGKMHFELHCSQCHGKKGNGKGPTAPFLKPAPRDLTAGKFDKVRLKSEHAISDLHKVILDGIPGTAMPSFKLLSKHQVNALAEYVNFLASGKQLPKEASRSKLLFPTDIEKGTMMDSQESQGTIINRVPIDVDRGMLFDGLSPNSPIRRTR